MTFGVSARARFLGLWTLSVAATSAAFILHLSLRGRAIDAGYDLGKARSEQGRLRELKRVLSLEVASHESPERVELVARSVLGMDTPPPERVITMGPVRASKPRVAQANAEAHE